MGQYWYPTRLSANSDQPHGSFRRLLHTLLLVATLLPLTVVIWVRYQAPVPYPLPPTVGGSATQPATRSVIPVQPALATRPLFAYSVIPGGATDRQELKNAVTTDGVVAAHYADFDVSKARLARLDRDRAAYVSYRLANHVYWTSHKVALVKGEAILTDGQHLARARCGNRISDIPRQPVSMKEPETAALETPVPELIDVGPLPELEGNLPFPLARPVAGSASPGTFIFFIPPLVPVGVGSGTGKSAPGTPGKPVSPSAPPLPTPEPATLLLVSAGLLAARVARQRIHT